jgi:hypothetical protein
MNLRRLWRRLKRDHPDASSPAASRAAVDAQDVKVSDLGVSIWKPQIYRAAIWVIGVGVASLTPLASSIIHVIDRGRWPDWYKLLSHGDLLIIGVVITVAGFVEVALSYKALQSRAPFIMLAVISGVMVLLAQAIWYGDISASTLGPASTASATSVPASSPFAAANTSPAPSPDPSPSAGDSIESAKVAEASSSAVHRRVVLAEENVTWGSLGLYVASIICGCACLLLPHSGRRQGPGEQGEGLIE